MLGTSREAWIALATGGMALVLGVVAIWERFVKWYRGQVREDELIERIAAWFPEDGPNGRPSLPAQVAELTRGHDQIRHDVADLKAETEQRHRENRSRISEVEALIKFRTDDPNERKP